MNIIIAGSRTFNDYGLLEQKLDEFIAAQHIGEPDPWIYSGAAKGADKLGEKYARERNYHCLKFPADWEKYGKSAGFRRNEEMAETAHALIAFWDGESKGTKHMIQEAKSWNLKIRVVFF